MGGLSLTFDQYIARLRTDFPFFCREMFRLLELDKTAPLGRVEIDMCRYLAAGPRRRGVLGPRGLGKTHLAAVLCCWLWLNDADLKIVLISKSEGAARDTRLMIRQWLEQVPFLTHLVPGAEDWQRDAGNKFDVGTAKADRTPSFRAIGIGGQLEGGRAHVAIPDDIETPENVGTMEARAQLDQDARRIADMLYPNGQIIYLGTYHHEESVYLKLEKRGYALRTWTLQYPYDPKDQFLNLAPMISQDLASGKVKPGDPTMPHRFGWDHINDKQAEGELHYKMQYMLVANLAGSAYARPLKLRDLMVYSCPRDKAPISIIWGTSNNKGSTAREDIPSQGLGTDRFYSPIYEDSQFEDYQGTRMRVDPAGSGADKVGYAIVGHLNGKFFTKAVGALAGGPTDENMQSLALLAKEHGVNLIRVESNFGGDAFANLLKVHITRHSVQPGTDLTMIKGWSAAVDTKPSAGQKEVRIINAVAAAMGSHRIVVDETVARNQDFQYQLTRITAQRNSLAHEDELECWALCIKDFLDELVIDPDHATKRMREKTIDDHIRENAGLLGPAHTPTSWGGASW